jgi:hypothetical protein
MVVKMVHSSILKAATKVLLLCATFSVILCSAKGYAMPDRSCLTRDSASLVAENFIKSDATFKFDGLEDTFSLRVEHANTLPDIVGPKTMGMALAFAIPAGNNEYTFKAKFDSRHSGYGDRTGKILAQVITPHVAEVIVENCQVKSAIMDGKLDMLTGKPV